MSDQNLTPKILL